VTRSTIPLALVSVALVLAGCSGSGGGGGGEATPGGGVLTLSATAFGDDGDGRIFGEVTLPAKTVAGTRVQVTYARSDPDPGGGSASGRLQETTRHLLYAVEDLPGGTYSVRLRVDVDDNGDFGDPGDYEGWFKGSVDDPILDDADADERELQDGERINMDFGLGEVAAAVAG